MRTNAIGHFLSFLCSPYGIRTRVTALKGQRPWPLDEQAIRKARVIGGVEPSTDGLLLTKAFALAKTRQNYRYHSSFPITASCLSLAERTSLAITQVPAQLHWSQVNCPIHAAPPLGLEPKPSEPRSDLLPITSWGNSYCLGKRI